MKSILLSLILLGLAACGGGGGGEGSTAGLVAVKRAPVSGPGGCGIRNAWIVREVGGVRLSRPAILSRRAAEALNVWVLEHADPIVGGRGGGPVRACGDTGDAPRGLRRGRWLPGAGRVLVGEAFDAESDVAARLSRRLPTAK